MAIFTAVFTVGLALYATRRKRRLDALRALYFEIADNERIAGKTVFSVSRDIRGRPTKGKGFVGSMVNFREFSFEEIVNDGTLLSLPGEHRLAIALHYEYIQQINTELDQFRNLRLQDGEYSSYNLIERFQQYVSQTPEAKLFMMVYAWLLLLLYAISKDDIEDLNSETIDLMFDNLEGVEKLSAYLSLKIETLKNPNSKM